MGKKSLTYYFFGGLDKLGRKIIPRYKRKEVTLFRYTGALGDALMLTTLAREVKKRNPSAHIRVVTGFTEIFSRNPDVNEVIHESNANIKGLGRYLMRYEHCFPWRTHLLNYCKECVDIKDKIQLQTYIFPDENDLLFAKNIITSARHPVILINRKAGPRTDKKNWPDAYWVNLIEQLTKNYSVVEVGNLILENNSISNKNYINLSGKTTIHQIAAIMTLSKLLICPVTGLLHLAAAFNLKTLCILGGSEPQIGTQYKNTFFLSDRPVCADCYEQGPCTNDFICLKNITPETVLLEAKNLLNTGG